MKLLLKSNTVPHVQEKSRFVASIPCQVHRVKCCLRRPLERCFVLLTTWGHRYCLGDHTAGYSCLLLSVSLHTCQHLPAVGLLPYPHDNLIAVNG
jgi:hypothetical protein